MLRLDQREDGGNQQQQPRKNSTRICVGKGMVGATHGLAHSSREGLKYAAAATLNASEEQ